MLSQRPCPVGMSSTRSAWRTSWRAPGSRGNNVVHWYAMNVHGIPLIRALRGISLRVLSWAPCAGLYKHRLYACLNRTENIPNSQSCPAPLQLLSHSTVSHSISRPLLVPYERNMHELLVCHISYHNPEPTVSNHMVSCIFK